MNEYDFLLTKMLFDWLETKDRQYTDAVYYIDRSHWQHRYITGITLIPFSYLAYCCCFIPKWFAISF